ncbi:MAG: HlyD family type I secretion periplasmic adaptor subunit, partial [Desulfobulbaceae bacterium]|nr:HlyD family type I secretion periplasmic adaptor subunit [Desulfobulbaceae bacterium]
PEEPVDFVTDIRASIMAQTPKGGRLIIWCVLLLFIIVMVWSYYAKIDEVTNGYGKVIPSQQIQVVQNLEGGILAEVLIKIGEVVEKDQLILKIDETRFSAPYVESRMRYLALKAKIARLEAEIKGESFMIPTEVTQEKPEIGRRELALFNSRKKEFVTTLEILNEQVIQRRQELAELEARYRELPKTYEFLKREIDLTRPLLAEGAYAEVEFLRLQRQASTMRGEIEAIKESVTRAKSRLQEANSRLEEGKMSISNRASEELNDAFARLEGLNATETALADRLQRTAVRSPVRGVVNQILVNTMGGVILPGMDLVEIVPLDDTLLIEATIKPSDIAFLHPNQKVTVQFTAYDFTIYGGLEANLEHISADSITDDKGNSFYLVQVRTNKNYLGTADKPLPIIPGMVASVNILTGKRRIITYLLKPILRAKMLALRER